MRRDPLSLLAGFSAIISGVDSGRSPLSLDAGQLSWAVNATSRGGLLQPRSGFFQSPLTFLDEVGGTVQPDFENGLFQGAGFYLTDSGLGRNLVSISGRIFVIDTSTYQVQDLTAISGVSVNHPTLPLTWWSQWENYLIIQNGSDAALIYDGASIRRSRWPQGVREVPTGTAMAYNNGRGWVARPDGYSFLGGNLAYSDGTRAAVLSFTDNDFLTGGAFMIPAGAGPIRAMRSIAIQDNSTGQGPLQVFTTRGVFSVNAPFLADDWAKLTSPIQTISLLAAGAVSANSTVNVNGDIWFRSSDGVRSFVVARRDHGTWVNTPLSGEVTRALRTDTPELLEFASAALFDNRLLVTTQPTPERDHGTYHKGLVALDFDPVSTMFNRSQPTWEGVWTGLKFLQLVPVETDPQRCLTFILSAENKIELWELSKSDRFDNVDQRIVWSIESPAYGFQDNGIDLKQLAYGDTWLNRIAGTVSVTVQYRPDSDPIWQSWANFQYCSTLEDCDLDFCTVPSTFLEQYRARVMFPAPSDACDVITNKPYRHGYRFATRVEVEGFCQISQLRLVARQREEPSEGACSPAVCTLSALVDPCIQNDFSYEII